MVERLRGKIWKGTVECSELDSARGALNVISTRLGAGRTEIHVSSDVAPGAAFEPAMPTVDDLHPQSLPDTT